MHIDDFQTSRGPRSPLLNVKRVCKGFETSFDDEHEWWSAKVGQPSRLDAIEEETMAYDRSLASCGVDGWCWGPGGWPIQAKVTRVLRHTPDIVANMPHHRRHPPTSTSKDEDARDQEVPFAAYNGSYGRDKRLEEKHWRSKQRNTETVRIKEEERQVAHSRRSWPKVQPMSPNNL